MISLMPTASSSQTSDAYVLLAIIADPEASRKRLDELVAEKKAALDAIEQARQANAAVEKLRARAADELAKAQTDADTFNASYAVRTQALEDRESALSTRQQQIDDQEKSVAAQEATLKSRETAVAQREQFLTAREEAATKLATDAKMVKDAYDAYDAKISALQSTMKSELKAEAG